MITFYNTNYNEFDPTKNGGGMVRAINNDLKHELIKRVRPNTAENGGIRWFKFFIRPKTKVLNVGVNLIKFTDSPTEEVYLSDSVANFESELDNPRLFGVFEVVDVDDKVITANKDVSEFVKVDDIVTFFNDERRVVFIKVEKVDNNKITLQRKSKLLKVGLIGSSTIFFDELDDKKGLWIKQVIEADTEAMEYPLNNVKLNIYFDKETL
jgi:hypothetical protein